MHEPNTSHYLRLCVLDVDVPSVDLYQAAYADSPASGLGLDLWGSLRNLIAASETYDASIVWHDQDQWQIHSWRFYGETGVHVLETVAGEIVYMFADKTYPIARSTLQMLLDHGLEIDSYSLRTNATSALMGFSVHLRIHNLTGYQRTGYSRVNGYCSGGSKLVAVKTLLGLSLVADLIHCYMFTLLLIHSFKTQQGQAGWLLAVAVAVKSSLLNFCGAFIYNIVSADNAARKIYYWDLTKPGHKKLSTSSKQPFVSSREATKGGSSKAPTSSKTGHSKKRKESNSAMDSNPSQPPVSTPVDTGMHKEDQQATGGPTSLGVTSEARANPQLSSGMSASNLNKPIYSASFIVHSESALGCDASADSTAEANPGFSAPSTDPHVLEKKNKFVSEGLETVLTQPTTGKGVSSIARQVGEEEASITIKLKDLAKLVSHVQPSFKDLDFPEDDPVIVVDDIPKSSSPRSSQIQEITNQVLILQSQKHKLELEKHKDKAEAALLKAQPYFPRLKKRVHKLEIELLRDLEEIPTKLDDFTKNVASVQAKLKTLDALPSLLLNVTQALNKFAQVLDSASSKAGDQSIPSAGQAGTIPAEGEKNTNQATISQLFQRRA
ncbi:hypothetical protein Tco_0211109 [Tanacetum coccineum]